jgi:NTE family protein
MNKSRDRLILILFLVLCLTGSIHGEDRQNTPKVALVLSGGGARAAAHIGVLKVLEREHIPIDCITATSFGALAGGLFSLGYSADEIEKIFLGQDWNYIFSGAPQRRFTSLMERRNARYQGQISFRGWKPELPAGLMGGQRLTEVLDVLTTRRMLNSDFDFDKLPIQFRAVSTNLIDGKPYIFKKGSMTEAFRASIAIPILFTPFEKDGMVLVDGGLVDNLPADIARSLGADIVIAVDATSPLLGKDEIHNFVDVIDQSISLQMERNLRENEKLATIILKPDLEKISNTDYNKIADIIKRGENEATRVLDQLRALVKDLPPRTYPALPKTESTEPIIGAITYHGLERIRSKQLAKEIQIHTGDAIDPSKIQSDIARLYATRLFDSVRYNLEQLGENSYRLIYILKEAPLHNVGLSLRYDNGYNFTALAEFTARQLFNTPTKATISSQFGGIENHFAAVRFISSSVPFLFAEPRGDILRLNRLDIRDKKLADNFTDHREGGRLMIGSSFLKHLEISGGYQSERVRISGGSAPNTLTDSAILAGPILRINRDSFDDQEFPHKGMNLKFQVEKRSTGFGGDLNYSKWIMDYRQCFTVSEKSTVLINGSAGYSRGSVPFYDLFFIGGYYPSEFSSRPFLGLERDELTARQMALFGASYRHQIFSTPFSLAKRGFLTGIYNGVYSSLNQTRPYNSKLFNGAGIGMAFETILGPIRATGGWGEGGRFNFYLSFGPSF